jgi:SnoaL-like domain
LKRLSTAIAALILALTGLISIGSSVGSTAPLIPSTADPARHGDNFDRFLDRNEEANTAFVNGDPSLWLSMTAEKDPASIFGGFGGLGEAGTEDVHQRYVLAATAFQPSGATIEFEYLVKDVRGRLAYTVAIERGEVLYSGQTTPQPHVLRSTMIFRFDAGDWRIVHRHADTMLDLELPTAA